MIRREHALAAGVIRPDDSLLPIPPETAGTCRYIFLTMKGLIRPGHEFEALKLAVWFQESHRTPGTEFFHPWITLYEENPFSKF